MLYRSLLLVFALSSAWSASAQSPATRQSQWADSLAGSEAAGLQQQFQLSPGQTDSLHQAWIQAYKARKQVFARYWKTDSFPVMINSVSRMKDSLYFMIMGQRPFQVYKDSLFRQQERQTRATSPSPKSSQP
jgi:hypothetical protein